MNAQERQHMLATAPIPGLVIRLSVPTIICMMITALYNMADTFFVGQIGTSATAAVGVDFDACPPVLEYISVSITKTLTSSPLAST